mmetsp:Transcript_56442/g.120076  ORF Transcript_56442/g.120076 Transcript_56442/m.120076 type:complete len:105 (-) Transcript_56442:527-841(-)
MPTDVKIVELAAAGHHVPPNDIITVEIPLASRATMQTPRQARGAAPKDFRGGGSLAKPEKDKIQRQKVWNVKTELRGTTWLTPCNFLAAMKIPPEATPPKRAKL